MAQRIDRSMNDELRKAAVDGRLRYLRPNAANAEMTEATSRSQALTGPGWGSMGVDNDDDYERSQVLPGAVHPLQPVKVGKHEVVDPL